MPAVTRSLPRSRPTPGSAGPDFVPAATNAYAPRPPAQGGRGRRPWTGKRGPRAAKPKAEPKILFQTFFKSVGPRTYAAQVKEAGNGNQFLVITEGKRDEKTNELKKCRVFVYSEDFPAFFRMIKESAEYLKAHPLSPEVKAKRDRYWKKHNERHAGALPAAAG